MTGCGCKLAVFLLVATVLPLWSAYFSPLDQASWQGILLEHFKRLLNLGTGSAACPCPGNTPGVWTTIDVQSAASSAKSEELISNALASSSLIVKSSRRLNFQHTSSQVHVEVLACDANADPVESYWMATVAQQALGGGAMSWSASVEPHCAPLNEDVQLYYKLLSSHSEPKELVATSESNFSRAAVWRIDDATSLLLNNVIMSNSRDEHVYHELLVHPALIAAEQPRQALIIGGGEGATLREVLDDSRIESVTMVDVDENLIKLCKQHLSMMHKGGFDSPKLKLIVDDGIQYLRRLPSSSFDVIIVDGIDFSWDAEENKDASYGNGLYQPEFYADIHRVLRDGGSFAQYMSDVDRDDNSLFLSNVGFSDFQYMCVDIDSFFGAGACFVLSGKSWAEPLATRLEQRAVNLHPKSSWKYLTPEVLNRCMIHHVRRLKGSIRSSGDGGTTASTFNRVLTVTAIVFGVMAAIAVMAEKFGVLAADPTAQTVTE
eukprot:TRINITY_DN17183_c1_g2_i1.p1 TRINITY_DN17183_c1_g2~~TRINITY_DN17183_c1_g2_i1.p1  ORF type:complete len:503 (-),score=74.96 TRINITY_DN17183_c1_g2_i1:201-1670(-)